MQSANVEQVDLLISAGCIVTVDQQRQIIRDGAIAIRGSDIVAIGPRDAIERAYVGLKTIHAPQGLITPGLIDAHNHPIDYLIKGMVDDTPQIVRLRDRVIPYEDQLTEEQAYASSAATFVEMIRQGTTCFVDGAGPMPHAVARAALDLGMRGIVARKLADIAGPFGGLIQDTDEAIALANETVERFNGAGDGLLRACYDLDMPAVVSDRLAEMVLTQALKRGVGIVAHLIGRRAPPGEPEVVANADIAWLHRLGLLGPHLLLAHIGWIPANDVALLAATKTNVVHCPASSLVGGNGWVAHGVIPDLVAGGVNVALGTDAAIIARTLDMVRIMNLASCVHKDARRDPLIMDPYTVFEMATIRGAKAVHWDDRIGSLEVGKAADLAIFDTSSPHWWPEPLGNPVPDLVYGGTGRDARTVVINGKVVMEDGNLIGVDVASIACAVRSAAAASYARLGAVPSGVWPLR
ncbi:amidohydrolase family protein [Pseudomonas fluorescens]|uniref:amidohydrolase family protein n=1 Tax=Pseudomonas fluorescens TaxID=294 RepID=UPI0002F7122C|nr:amidohydrolase family protein [Pseudomonas fluorescens]